MTNAAVALEKSTLLEQLLDEQFLPAELEALVGAEASVPWSLWESALYGPLSEFFSRPGKGFRARVVDAGWRLGKPTTAPPAELAMIVEVLHAGSLIIDDIEDESAYRRGRPALHCSVGIPLALNAGNWLYFWPQWLLTRIELPAEAELLAQRAIGKTLLRAHSGQALDLATRIQTVPQRDVAKVVTATSLLKTGALMELGAKLGALAAGIRGERLNAIGTFGRQMGLALQMLDDLTSLTNDARCHKGHEDLVSGRPTWPFAWLADELDEVRFAKLQQDSRSVQERNRHPEALSEALLFLLGPDPKKRVRKSLDQAFDVLRQSIGDNPVLEQLAAELTKLEQSYG